MAHKKGLGSSKNGRDSNPQMLGVKIYGGQLVNAGTILVRQRGTKITAGTGVGLGRDDTLFAMVAGHVKYERVGKDRRRVTVAPADAPDRHWPGERGLGRRAPPPGPAHRRGLRRALRARRARAAPGRPAARPTPRVGRCSRSRSSATAGRGRRRARRAATAPPRVVPRRNRRRATSQNRARLAGAGRSSTPSRG